MGGLNDLLRSIPKSAELKKSEKKKMHRLKTRPIFTKASQTKWREPFDFPAGISAGFSGLL